MTRHRSETGHQIFAQGWTGSGGFVLRDPLDVLTCDGPENVVEILEVAAEQARSGKLVAGMVAYEAASAFDTAYVTHEASGPLVWFGVYDPASAQAESDPKPPISADVGIRDAQFSLSRSHYEQAFAGIQHAIREGFVYQINFTAPLTYRVDGDPLIHWRDLLHRQPVPYAAYLDTGDQQILSCSPELFFQMSDRHVLTRPMKGTVRRGSTPSEDDELAARLAADPKSRAENVMIVDLLRNDLSRCCDPGTVRVPRLFSIERYASLIQMTSDIEGRLREGAGVPDVFAALFPCGSVTGAPKIEAMRQISALERGPRGAYCGAVGWMRGRNAVFNVAIRTAVLRETHGVLGIGSGIVADSEVVNEYEECLLKARFLTDSIQREELMEALHSPPDRRGATAKNES